MNQQDLILSYYKKFPGKEIVHAEVVDWVTNEYSKLTGKVLRDPDRAIRKLAQEGQLIKISKGIYKYDPGYIVKKDLEDFSQKDKKYILKRDGYRCVICGKGALNGIELHVDHIKPKDFGGKAIISNGQTLCAQHNFQKKNYNQTETGKKMFIRLMEAAESIGDRDTVEFCKNILLVYEKFNINGHIEWD